MATILTALAAAIPSTADYAGAATEYLDQFHTAYPDAVGSRIDNCSLCHTASSYERNLYGTAWQTAGRSFTAINGADSDSDGFTNLAEITALTYPGNDADYPAPPPSPPTAGQLLLSDFSEATLDGDPDWDRILGRFGGVRQKFVNLPAGRSVSLMDDAIAGLAPFGGGRIETGVRFINPLLRTRAEVLFDYVDARNHRFVRLDRATGRLVVGQVGTVGGVGASVLSVRLPKLFARLGIWHHLRVDVDPVAGTVKVYVDKAALPALTKTYAETGIGRVGVAATGARRTVVFDNVVVFDNALLP